MSHWISEPIDFGESDGASEPWLGPVVNPAFDRDEDDEESVDWGPSEDEETVSEPDLRPYDVPRRR